MTAHYQEAVDTFINAMFVQHDPKAAAQVYAEDADYWEPFLPAPIRGRQALLST